MGPLGGPQGLFHPLTPSDNPPRQKSRGGFRRLGPSDRRGSDAGSFLYRTRSRRGSTESARDFTRGGRESRPAEATTVENHHSLCGVPAGGGPDSGARVGTRSIARGVDTSWRLGSATVRDLQRRFSCSRLAVRAPGNVPRYEPELLRARVDEAGRRTCSSVGFFFVRGVERLPRR